MTIMAGRSLLTALLFYWVYDEKLRAKHLIGMVLLILCIVLIAIGTN
jgi:multidrug transporter EmrE-like cation transporter